MRWRASAAATKPLAFVVLDEFRERRRGGVAARRGQAHRLLDDHEAAGQQANAADARGVGLELLLDAGRDVGVLRQELVDDHRRGRRAHELADLSARLR